MSTPEIQVKIQKAREAAKSLEEKLPDRQSIELFSKLSRNADKLELVYSDLVVKEQKSISASKLMHELEKELDELIAAAKLCK
jgi:hypothetical protein